MGVKREGWLPPDCKGRTTTQPARPKPSRLTTPALIPSLAPVPPLAPPISAEILHSPDGTKVIIREPAPGVPCHATHGGMDTYQTTPGLVNPYPVSPAVVNPPVVAPPQGRGGCD